MNGIIVINKSAGMTSHDVCFKLRKIFKTKKIGHAGTLDPMAEGVLVALVGSATRLSQYAMAEDKEYIVGIKFGQVTDTLDTTGTLIAEITPDFNTDSFDNALKKYTGDISQYPPMYSAIKYNGKHLYEYARKGESVDLKPRNVKIYSIVKLNSELPLNAQLKINCTKGTYIRSLCADIGEELGCGAVMSSLTRTKSGKFNIENSYTLDELNEINDLNELSKLLLPLDDALMDFQRVDVRKQSERILLGGNLLLDKNIEKTSVIIENNELVRLYIDDIFIAIGQKQADGIKPIKVFNDSRV